MRNDKQLERRCESSKSWARRTSGALLSSATRGPNTTRRKAALDASIDKLHLERDDIRREETTAVRRHLSLAEKPSLLEALRKGAVGACVFEELAAEVDTRLADLEAEAHEDKQVD